MGLALVRDMRELRAPSNEDEVAAFETDVLAGFVLARASAGLADSTVRNDAGHSGIVYQTSDATFQASSDHVPVVGAY